MNELIRAAEVRVIADDGEQLGVMTPADAIERAQSVGLDLVEVAPGSKPPVCRIMDYGRYKYEQKKKRTGKNKQAHAAALKEVKLRPGTDMHDLTFKLNNARRFLMDGDKVKVTVMFRGREMVHTSRGRHQLDEVVEQLKGVAKLENAPRMEGRFMSMILVPDREAIAEAKKRAAAARKSEAESSETKAAASEGAPMQEEVSETNAEAANDSEQT